MKERQAELKERLQEALIIREMRAADLCERTGIPKGAISYYLSGKSQPKADRLHLIAKALDVSEAWLLGFDVSMERELTLTSERQMLSEGEKMLLELFNQVPKDQQRMVIEMIRVALKKKE